VFDVVLYQPEIPPNTGNIIRLCANTGSRLHLVHPLGFDLDDARLRRAGLDYHEWVGIAEFQSLNEFLLSVQPGRVFACSTRSETRFTDVAYRAGDAFLFGPETRGLPQSTLDMIPPERRIRIPMRAGNRSLNLSNAVAVVVYEAWRQNGFLLDGEYAR
jgi:tRNA (cytidine/uridine-2'-O-)-methyltransferase